MTKGSKELPRRANEWDYTTHSVKGRVKKYGNGAHIVLPKAWLGKEVIVRVVD